jgi:hypothetical protein
MPALLLGTIATLSLAGPASALGTHNIHVKLNGAQEVPPVSPAGTGEATVTYDDVTGAVSVSGTYTGMTSNTNLAHIHGLAPPGMNAGIIVNLTPTGGTSGSFSGSGTLTPAQVTGMLNGNTYLNLHTAVNGSGEARGQIHPPGPQVPAMSWQWMAALVVVVMLGGGFVLARRPA